MASKGGQRIKYAIWGELARRASAVYSPEQIATLAKLLAAADRDVIRPDCIERMPKDYLEIAEWLLAHDVEILSQSPR